MVLSDVHELMTSPEIFRVNLSFENRPFEGQISRTNHCFSNVEMPSLFNSIVVKLFETWVTTGHGDLLIKSETRQNKIRVFLHGSPTYLFYVSPEQLAEIRQVSEYLSEKAISRLIRRYSSSDR